jgi:hypothetical protein
MYEEFRRGSTGGKVEATEIEATSIEEPTVSISWKGTSSNSNTGLDQTQPQPQILHSKKGTKTQSFQALLKKSTICTPVLENASAWGKTADLLLPQFATEKTNLLTIATM